jgi:hypothetical protein
VPTTSTITAIKAVLLDSLSDALPGTQVTYGFPGELVERECVWLGEVRGRNLLVTMGPPRVARDEEFDLHCYFDALLLAGTQAEAETRAFTMFAALEDAVADDPSLGGLVSTGAYLSEFSASTALADVGATARIEATVTFKTRLF